MKYVTFEHLSARHWKNLARWDRIVARWCAGREKQKHIFSADLFQILSDTFTINIGLVSEQTWR
ncbi:hypothetical protein MtrunA17_Chr4g0029391 [Medicago truncatula]|uniref:Uncharacterized protein n=1 Tax=Medicago truncatula TaxID=3880 RepID=A0A396I564_MEDTR|nr:hypothetical protein MtrunA17_Chr4g0029391 [Medicago truncatula]